MSLEKTKNLELVSVDILSAGGTHPGLKRDNNEDRFVLDASYAFFMVVDGMGGHQGGEVASKIAAETIQNGIRKIEGPPAKRLFDAIVLANNEIFETARSNDELEGMGCVLTAVLVVDGIATVAHVGDTRLYSVRKGALEKITVDHSPIGEIEGAGGLSEISLMRHPRRHEVSRCLGLSAKTFECEDFVDIFQTDFSSHTALLLCSDGLSDLVTAGEIQKIINWDSDSPAATVRNLIREANRAGGKDNITVVFVAGDRFFQTSGTNEERAIPLAGRIIELVFSRWTFLLFGLLFGALAVFFYFTKLLQQN